MSSTPQKQPPARTATSTCCAAGMLVEVDPLSLFPITVPLLRLSQAERRCAAGTGEAGYSTLSAAIGRGYAGCAAWNISVRTDSNNPAFSGAAGPQQGPPV